MGGVGLGRGSVSKHTRAAPADVAVTGQPRLLGADGLTAPLSCVESASASGRGVGNHSVVMKKCCERAVRERARGDRAVRVAVEAAGGEEAAGVADAAGRAGTAEESAAAVVAAAVVDSERTAAGAARCHSGRRRGDHQRSSRG
jgi:hypothetical protein